MPRDAVAGPPSAGHDLQPMPDAAVPLAIVTPYIGVMPGVVAGLMH